MLAAVFLYVGGLAQFSLAYRGGLTRLVNRLRVAGTDTDLLLAAVMETRYGLPQPATFIRADAALVADPPLPTQQWYAVLAALVVVPIVAFAINRAAWSRRPYKWVTINELVALSIASGIAAAAIGGVLLAGIVVMPFVYLVIIKHTRKAKRFKPSYLYVLAVSLPLIGLGLDLAGVATGLYMDLLTLAVPVPAVVVLLLSAFVRPRIKALF
jgi:hypothetical protein